METIAVYWESKIRTYGLNLLEGLTLHRMTLPPDRLGQWGAILQSQDPAQTAFRLAWAQAEAIDRFTICLVYDPIHAHAMQPVLDPPQIPEGSFDQVPVDVVYFQGPHFGDRYGILDFALQALAPANVPLVGMVCAMATIYLVFPNGWGCKAREILDSAFEIPTTTSRKAKEDSNGARR